MPVKRRLDKRGGLDDYRRQELLEGPGGHQLAGVGYLGPFKAAAFDQLGPEDQASVMAAMRQDWADHGATLMVWWRSGEHAEGVQPWCWVPAGGPDCLPWAGEQFGEP